MTRSTAGWCCRDELMEHIGQRVLREDPTMPPPAQFIATMLFESFVWQHGGRMLKVMIWLGVASARCALWRDGEHDRRIAAAALSGFLRTRHARQELLLLSTCSEQICLPLADDFFDQKEKLFLGDAKRAGPAFNRVVTTTGLVLVVRHSTYLIQRKTRPSAN